jgi:raffinose/stachyose/melibiose transport system substrate-binding protein
VEKKMNARLFAILALTSGIFLMVFGGVAAQDGPVVVTMWHIAVDADPLAPAIEGAIERFNAAHDDIQVEAQAIENDAFKTQLQVAVAAGEQPDIFQTWGGGVLQGYVEGGVVRPIEELSGEAGELFIPGSLAPATFNGEHYAVPANLAGVFLWTNVTMFEEYGLELPSTWDQLMTACQTFSEAGIVPIGLGNVQRWPAAFWLIYLASRAGGPEPFTNAYNRVEGASFADPAFIEAGERIQEAVNAGCFEQGYNGTHHDDMQLLVATGGAAMQLQGDWYLGGLNGVDPDFTAANIRPLPFPTLPDSDADPTLMVGGTGQAFAISADAPPEANAALIEMFSSPEFGQELAELGFIPALVGYDQYITNPLVQEAAATLAEASYVQLYYDQFLPPELAQVHLDTTQRLFGLETTPEEAAEEMETTAQTVLTGEASS